MENPEGVLNLLDEFAKLKSKEIPSDLEEYLSYVAASGDPVYQWSLIKNLYRQKLINVITEFYEMCPIVEIPRCPNVDPFNYETMKNSLLKRLDSFSSAPFTIQRISELLTTPRKQYNRVDKFMRAIEKNIWVVSTREPGAREPSAPQETSTNLVNGVSPRVCVTVKHPKRIKSIEDRIKSGHPQLIDDEEDEEGEDVDEFEQLEEETNTQILPNNVVDEASLQCTSVKDLIEKYENGTIFSNAEEKTNFEEKANQLEESVGSTGSVTTTSGLIESSSSSSSLSNTTSTTTEVTAAITTTAPSDSITSVDSDMIPSTTTAACSEVTSLSDTSIEPMCEVSSLEGNKEITSAYAEDKDTCTDFIDCHTSENTIDPVSLQDSVVESEHNEITNDKCDLSEMNSAIETTANEFPAADSSLMGPDCEMPMEESNTSMVVEAEEEGMTLNVPSVEDDSNENQNISSAISDSD